MKIRNGGILLFDQRSYALFKEITNHEQVTKAEGMRKLNLSERQFNYDLDKINHALKRLNIPEVEIVDNLFLMDKKLREAIKSDMLLDMNPNTFVISEQDRVFLIYLYTFIRKEPISNYHYQLLLGVSKNTALADVKRAKELCFGWDITLVYSRVDGYHLKGSELDKRRLVSYCIDTLLSQSLGKEIIVLALKSWGQDDYLVLTQWIIEEHLEENEINLVKSRKNEMIIRLAFVRSRNKSEQIVFNESEKKLVQSQGLFEQGKRLSNKLFNKDGDNESFYVTLQLLIALQEFSSHDNPSLGDLAEQIIDEFERVTLIPIENKMNLKRSLYNHLIPSFFRITFKIPLVNPLTKRIKKEYAELFQFVKRALEPLTMWTGKSISEDEIGYFTLHFGGYLDKNKRPKSEKLSALIVCSNGISSSMMLKAQLNEMCPDITFSAAQTVGKIPEISTTSFDLIFSTVNVLSIKPVYIVKPLLSQVEKNYLIQAVISDFPKLDNKSISVDQIIEVVGKYADIKDNEKLFSELVDILHLKNTEKGRFSPMLSELLTEDMINFTNEDLEWKDAIKNASQPLVDTSKVEKRYVDAMIKNVEEVGTYIHIGKGIAIPHARPEAGVKSIGMSYLRTKRPVLLLGKEEHAIDIFICIAAIDSKAHLKALAQLTRILADDAILQLLKEAETAEQIIKIIKKGEKK